MVDFFFRMLLFSLFVSDLMVCKMKLTNSSNEHI
jgi:hypothetical protein